MQSIHQNNVCTALIRESNEDCSRGPSKQMCKRFLFLSKSLLKLVECISVGNLSLPAFQHMKLRTFMGSLWVRVNCLTMHSCSDFYDNMYVYMHVCLYIHKYEYLLPSCTFFFFWTFQFLTYKKMFRIHLNSPEFNWIHSFCL